MDITDTSNYPTCPKCGGTMFPVTFTEEETEITFSGTMYKTGRKRTAVSHFECPNCWTKECVDDSFCGPWHK